MNACAAFTNKGSLFAFLRSFKNAFTVRHLCFDFAVIPICKPALYLNFTTKTSQIPLFQKIHKSFPCKAQQRICEFFD